MKGEKAGDGRIQRTTSNIFSLDDAGVDEGTLVSDDCTSEASPFTGKVLKATIELN